MSSTDNACCIHSNTFQAILIAETNTMNRNKTASEEQFHLERADLLALVCGVCCEFVTFPLVSWVRCGT